MAAPTCVWSGATSTAFSTNTNWDVDPLTLPAISWAVVSVVKGATTKLVGDAATYGHVVAGDIIRVSGALGTWWSTNLNSYFTVQSVDFTAGVYSIFILLDSSAATSADYTASSATAILPQADLVFSGVPAGGASRYCVTGPNVDFIARSITFAIGADVVTPPNVLGTASTTKTISIGKTLAITEGTATGGLNGGAVFGTVSGLVPILLPGCTGTVQVYSRKVSSYAQLAISVNAGASLVITTTAQHAADTSSDSQIDYGGTIDGAVIINGTGRARVRSTNTPLSSGSSISIGVPAGSANTVCPVPGSTITVPAGVSGVVFAPTVAWTGGTVNSHSPCLLYSSGTFTAITTGAVTWNAYAPLALANLTISSSLIVNSYGYPVEVCDVAGTYTVTGTVANAQLARRR